MHQIKDIPLFVGVKEGKNILTEDGTIIIE
jgi:hypothetical protein